VKLVAFDGQPEGKLAIDQGKIYADPVQYPQRIGRETAQVIARYFAGEKVPAEVLIPTELYRRSSGAR
jgi:ribose transport system substrate-binding protein